MKTLITPHNHKDDHLDDVVTLRLFPSVRHDIRKLIRKELKGWETENQVLRNMIMHASMCPRFQELIERRDYDQL